MKKFTIAILVLLMLPLSQMDAQRFGVKGGVSISNLATDDGEVEDKNSRVGWTAGVFMSLPVIDEVLAIQPEVNYTQKGGKYNLAGVEVESESGYFEIPILVQLTVLKPLVIYAGPQFSYLANVSTTYNEGGFIEVTEDDDVENYNRTDVGGAIGLMLVHKNFSLDARVSKGTIDYDKDRTIAGIELESNNLKNLNFQVTAGISF